MKKDQEFSDEQILEYIDGTLADPARMVLAQLITTDRTFAKRVQQLRTTHDLLQKSSVVAMPSRNFSVKVMENLYTIPGKSQSLWQGLLLLGGVIILVVLCAILLANGFFDGDTTLDPNQVSVVRKYIPSNLPSVDLNGKWIVNAIIILNLAIAFVVLDRSVLRPYFQRRTQAGF